MSEGKVFTHNDDTDHLYDSVEIDRFKKIEETNKKVGTSILMQLSNFTKKHIQEVFDMYSTIDDGFVATSIPIKNAFENGNPVSRSHAKRLYNRFEKFSEVTLDFKGVEFINQGFAHELFVVFPKSHPEVKLNPINANDDVKKND